MTQTAEFPSIEQIAEKIDIPAERWQNNCHVVSLHVVRSGLFGEPGPDCRVVRGTAPGYNIAGQHSWIALGPPFDPATRIVDVTAHTWGRVHGIVTSSVGQEYQAAMDSGRGHVLHGYLSGTIWEYGRPKSSGEPFKLDTTGLSSPAKYFVSILGEIDKKSWLDLVTYPHGGWPAHEICEAIVDQVPNARVYLPIDVLAHVTDTNPDDLYW